jgi:hypothetical protein
MLFFEKHDDCGGCLPPPPATTAAATSTTHVAVVDTFVMSAFRPLRLLASLAAADTVAAATSAATPSAASDALDFAATTAAGQKRKALP